MRSSIAISCVLIAASAGAGFALSAVHKATLTPASVAAPLTAPVAAVRAAAATDSARPASGFVIPTYVPTVAAPDAGTSETVAEPLVQTAVLNLDAAEGPERPRLRPDWDYVATTRHLDAEAFELPERTVRVVRTSYLQPAAPARAAAMPSAKAPMIVSHVSAQNIGGGATQPDYAHGVYR